MKKFLLVFSVIFALGASAQFRGSAGLEMALPFEDDVNFGIGVSAGGEYLLNDNMGLTAQLGYIYLFTDYGSDVTLSMIPIQFGYKYYLSSNTSGFYLHGQLGFHVTSIEMDFFGTTISDSSTDFSLAFGGGYMVNENVEIGLRYNMVMGEDDSGYNYLGLRVAYNF